MMWPHLAVSLLAPTTATVRGEKSASSRSGGGGGVGPEAGSTRRPRRG